jgi:formamidopyrimidine-DNA glycosylase
MCGKTRLPQTERTMPELPDLTVFAESLAGSVLDKKITGAAYHRNKRINVDPGVFCHSLQGKRLAGVKRVGKALLFVPDGGDRFLVHLMLSGGFKLCRKGEEVPSAVLTLDFEDDSSLVLFDQRGLATITVHPDLGGTAVDALEVTGDYLARKLKEKPKMTIKEFLIDQGIIAGIGNAYSDEILWHARISPRSITGKLPPQSITGLASAIPRVLRKATDQLRKANPGMMSGEIRDHLAVHKPKAKLSPSGAAILTARVGSKKTYYTDEQILYE